MNDPRYGEKPPNVADFPQWAKDVACTTKRWYPTKSQAKKKLKELKRLGRRGLVIYQCWHCERYHIGYPPGQQTYQRSGSVYG